MPDVLEFPALAASLQSALARAPSCVGMGVRVGVDLASASDMAESLRHFGSRFTRRLFTEREVAEARSVQGEAAFHERLAARFAAKEAVIKALDLPEAGVSWRDIELLRAAHGGPTLALYGRAAEAAQGAGIRQWAVSISHDAGRACAAVVALGDAPASSNS